MNTVFLLIFHKGILISYKVMIASLFLFKYVWLLVNKNEKIDEVIFVWRVEEEKKG